jgi:hypothetical protein
MVKAVSSNDHNYSRFGQLVDDTRIVLNFLSSWQIHHINRITNKMQSVLFIWFSNKSVKSLLNKKNNKKRKNILKLLEILDLNYLSPPWVATRKN